MVVPVLKLVWTLALVPELAQAFATHDQARALIETVLAFVEANIDRNSKKCGSIWRTRDCC